MKYIFINNYRGFSNTFIPITDVNFFVGENSTGKTSILGLLYLLASPDIWLKYDLDIRKSGFGTFKDLVSINSTDRTYFSVGYIFDSDNSDSKDKENKTTALLVNFIDNEGVPKISKIISFNNGTELSIKFEKNNIKYKTDKINFNCCASSFIEKHYLDWTDKHFCDKKGYTLLRKTHPFLIGAPPLIIYSFLTQAIIEPEKSKNININIPSIFSDIVLMAPIRSKPKTTYDEFNLEFSPEGDHIPYLIKKKFDGADSKSLKFKTYLSDFGKQSGLFNEIKIKKYGKGSTDPFELDIVINNKPINVRSVGYGVSQVLPVIVEIFANATKWYAIQQPEVHLHPKAQAELGDIFYNLSSNHKKKFIIETHSDYLIDRFRIACRNNEQKIESQILFFERSENGNTVTPIKIDANGNISNNQPESYRDFFIKEEMNLLDL